MFASPLLTTLLLYVITYHTWSQQSSWHCFPPPHTPLSPDNFWPGPGIIFQFWTIVPHSAPLTAHFSNRTQMTGYVYGPWFLPAYLGKAGTAPKHFVGRNDLDIHHISFCTQAYTRYNPPPLITLRKRRVCFSPAQRLLVVTGEAICLRNRFILCPAPR